MLAAAREEAAGHAAAAREHAADAARLRAELDATLQDVEAVTPATSKVQAQALARQLTSSVLQEGHPCTQHYAVNL